MSKARAFTTAAAASVLSAAVALQTASAEEGTVEAFSSWKAQGQIFPTGVDEATFVGVLSGVIYVKEDDQGLDASTMDAGLISCPGRVTINTSDGSQVGDGKCVMVTAEGDRVYASFKCEGAYLEGCNGEFTLAGGTGEMAEVSGGGPIQFKSSFTSLSSGSPGTIVEQGAIGLAVWPKLTYSLP